MKTIWRFLHLSFQKPTNRASIFYPCIHPSVQHLTIIPLFRHQSIIFKIHSWSIIQHPFFQQPIAPSSPAFVIHASINGWDGGSYRDRSLWIWTVWWWLQSPSVAERWSVRPCRWSSPPHSSGSEPSGSTRLPLRRENRKQKVRRRQTFPWIATYLVRKKKRLEWVCIFVLMPDSLFF